MHASRCETRPTAYRFAGVAGGGGLQMPMHLSADRCGIGGARCVGIADLPQAEISRMQNNCIDTRNANVRIPQ